MDNPDEKPSEVPNKIDETPLGNLKACSTPLTITRVSKSVSSILLGSSPSLPYWPGRFMGIDIYETYPPAPFGPGYGSSLNDWPDKAWMKNATKLQQVLAYPPTETQWPFDHDHDKRRATMTITKALSVGEARGAQLVACSIQIDGQLKPQPQTLVAKIYDPLYYPYKWNDVDSVVRPAEMDYSREATAYEYIQKTNERQKPDFAPKYWGSWKFRSIVTSQGIEHERWVCLISTEYVDGISLFDLYAQNSLYSSPDGFHYDKEYRLSILAELLDGVVKQFHAGINQRDLSPRNVMLVPNPQEHDTTICIPRVVLIDYNIAVVWPYSKGGPHCFQDPVLPPNPAHVYSRGPPLDLEGWLDPEFYTRNRDSNYETWEEWLQTTFGGKHAARFAPMVRKESERAVQPFKKGDIHTTGRDKCQKLGFEE
ncbi:hypothetical protein F4808DRAFT_410177 [Astrocystis sublimbata]|nr:hypothetical protein F4808DRAFT_410177 [Astrocystis sublimbata]